MPFKKQTNGRDKTNSKQQQPKSANKKSDLSDLSRTSFEDVLQRAKADPRALTPDDLFYLQQTIGNQAIGHLLSQPQIIQSKSSLSNVVQRASIDELDGVLKTFNSVKRNVKPLTDVLTDGESSEFQLNKALQQLDMELDFLKNISEIVAKDHDHEIYRSAYGGIYDFAYQLGTTLRHVVPVTKVQIEVDRIVDNYLFPAMNNMKNATATLPSINLNWRDSENYRGRSRDEIFHYILDGKGRTVRVEAVMDRRDLNFISGSSVSKSIIIYLESLPQWRALLDDGGHIVGKQFGGSGGDRKNVVMQDKNQNQLMAGFEDKVELAICAKGQAKLVWRVSYFGDTQRPSLISLQASFQDGEEKFEIFGNPNSDEGEAVEYGPHANDVGLKKLVAVMYKGANPANKFEKIGNGSTADIIEYELRTGKLPGRKPHKQKGLDLIQGLKNWLSRKGKTATKEDVQLAKRLIKNLDAALATQRKK